MGLNGAFGLGIALYFADEASAGMDRVTEKFRTMDTVSAASIAKFEANVKQFKVGVSVMAAGAAVLGAAFALAAPAGKFEQSLADLQSISGATTAEFGQLREAALQAGIATQFSPTEAVNALRELSAQGFSAKESMELLKPALDLAAASLGELGVAEAAQLSAQMLKAFGIEAADAAKSVDKLLQASNLFALSPKDLPLALGIGSRGAQLMHQTLDETLISLGLVKNIIPTVERASTAVAVAMEHLAAPQKKQAAEIVALGLKTTDAAGKFLPFLDVLDQLATKTKSMTQAQQAASLQRIFGAEALGGVQAILTQVNNGIKTTTGEVLTGAAAIAYLRGQMSSADGVAKEFADRRLDTFEGQKTLLRGSMETLAIALGEPFAKALKPVVGGIVAFVNRVIQIVKAIPDGTKEGIAKFVIAFGSLLTMFGALIAMKAAIVAVSVAISIAGGAIAAAAVAMLPILAALAAGILLFRAFQVNAESSGNSIFSVFSKVGLLFKALAQVFNTGEFSGAVLDDLNKAENGGIKAFAIQVYVWAGRIKNFFDGIAEGFSQAIIQLQPTFDLFIEVLKAVGAAFGISLAPAQENIAAWESAGDTGREVGAILAGLAGVLVNGLTVAVYAAGVAVQTFKEIWRTVGPIVGPIVDTIVGGIKIVIGLLNGDWRMAWRGAMDVVFGLMDSFGGVMFSLVRTAAKTVDILGSIFGKDIGATKLLQGLQDEFKAEMAGTKQFAVSMVGAEASRPAPVPGFIRTAGGAVPETLASPQLLAGLALQQAFPGGGALGLDLSAGAQGFTPAPAGVGFRALGLGESLSPPAANVAPLLTEQSLVARAEKAKGSALSVGEVDAIQSQLEETQRQLRDLKTQKGSADAGDIVNHITVQVGDEVVVQSVNRQKRSNDARAFKPTKGDDS